MEKKRKKEEIGEGIEELLTRLRKEKEWSYADVLTHIEDKTLKEKDIKKWEVGLIYPDLDMLYQISAIYSISTAELIQAKNNSFEKGMASINMNAVKWISYILNVSIKVGMVILVVLYFCLAIGSLLFFAEAASKVKRAF